jgi:1-acyl-sn-glycerol-3-phosphate acyltransferase
MAKFIFQLLYSIYTWAFVIFAMSTHLVISFLVSFFVKDKEDASIKIARVYLKVGMFLCGMRLTVKGAENIPKEGVFMLVSNHQSIIDIAMLMFAIPRKFAFVAKKELGKIPLLGWDLRMQGHVLIDRDNARQALREMESLKKKMINGEKSLLFFPEGTRTLDGSIGEFKKGPYKLAVQTGVKLIPIRIDGTMDILHKKSLVMKPGKVRLVIGEPITVERKDNKQEEKQYANELMNQTREIIDSLI